MEETFPEQPVDEPPPVVIEGEEEWELDCIVKSAFIPRSRPRKVKWYVAFKGYGTDHYDWLKIDDMVNTLEMIQDFQRDNPKAPGLPKDVWESLIQEREAERIDQGYYENPE
ncbi:hypothetical protein PQX77_018513, partial [Marasmius sp. AFHP31]